LVLVALASLMLVPTPVQAYIEPATRNFLIQLVAAGLLAGILSMKPVWRRLTRLGRRRAGREETTDDLEGR
jgi:hypothetical protein